FDVNIAGKHLAKLCNESNLQGSNHIFNNPALRQKYVTHWENLMQKTYNNTTSIKRLYQIPLIRTRSKLVAETIFANFTSALNGAYIAFDRCDAESTMLSIVMSLESYKLTNGKYPENLETLVPKYLDMMPIDPCTGRTTFVYKLRETSTKTTTEETPKPKELPYILYSLGPNAKDDGGIPIGQKGQKFNEYDLVF
ncbi:MAG: hypothetical protein LBH59_10630, partial [Planctomycetaceae bacterium]|nr:hypothetical protein [Planctomycetaceae bacterium]